MISAFPKIFTLGTRYIQNIFEDEVIVEEKLDGSQFSFAKIDGEMIYRSKGCRQMLEQPDKLFKLGIDYLESIKEIIPENIQFYCEYMAKPKHNTICYERIPKNYFMLFGLYNLKEQLFLKDRKFLSDWADILGMERVPTLFQGKINSFDEIKNLLNTISFCGKSKIEGIVIKNYNKDVLVGGQVLPIMCGKFVLEEFKEVHNSNWAKENTGKGRWDVYKNSFQTEARWLKAIFYLRDNNELENSPKDIGKLMKRVNIDIEEEEKENIKDFLWKEFGREVLKTATRGLPEFYKEYLAKQNFGETDE
jgi:hypothetical protein